MRRRRVVLAVLSALVLSGLAAGFAGPATAGGPTSVLLVDPGSGRTAALYNGDPEYQGLARLVGAFETVTGSTTPPKGADDNGASGTNDASGAGVTVTWLMHDVEVWRVDRIYTKAEGGPLISTQSSMDGGDLWSRPPTWRNVSAEGKALIALLDDLGVGSAGAGTAVKIPATAPIAPSSDRPGLDRWGWGGAGVLLGIALTLAAVKLTARTTKEVSDTGPAETGPTTAEVLTSHPAQH